MEEHKGFVEHEGFDEIHTELNAIGAWLCLLGMALNDKDSEPTVETLRTALLDLQVRVGKVIKRILPPANEATP